MIASRSIERRETWRNAASRTDRGRRVERRRSRDTPKVSHYDSCDLHGGMGERYDVVHQFCRKFRRGLPPMKTRTKRKGTRPDLFPRSTIFLALAISLVVAKEKHNRARVYAHLYDNGRRPTVATTVIHDHVDLTNASTSAREYVFIGLYTATRLYACVSHPGISPLFNFVRTSSFSLPSPFAISGPTFRSNKTATG